MKVYPERNTALRLSYMENKVKLLKGKEEPHQGGNSGTFVITKQHLGDLGSWKRQSPRECVCAVRFGHGGVNAHAANWDKSLRAERDVCPSSWLCVNHCVFLQRWNVSSDSPVVAEVALNVNMLAKLTNGVKMCSRLF